MDSLANTPRPVWQALLLWTAFIGLAIIINGTIPFMLGRDMREWTYAPLKDVLFNLLVYGGLFLISPLVLIKGWHTVRQPAFLLPLLLAILALTLRTFFRPTAILAVIVLAYLHWRFNLADIGLQSRGWRGDGIAILLFGLIYFAPTLWQAQPLTSAALPKALLASFDRLFLNPASTAEYLFYFGFLAERLSSKTGPWLTPFIIATMYTAHEMSNPEYWYENLKFPLIFVGIALTTWIYLWRRSIVVIWLGDGLGRFINNLF